MTDREKLLELLLEAEKHSFVMASQSQEEQIHGLMAQFADHLLANGVTFAKDTNVGSKWISVEDDKPDEFVSVLGHMTDAGDFPPVRECYKVGNVFFFPALQDIHPIDKWAYMPGVADG